jgi:hypothetical protein
MAYDKKSVVLYAYYEMISSYFNSCKPANDYVVNNLFMHFKDSNADMQYSCEDYAIYSIENVLPKFLPNVNLEDYDAVVRMNKEEGVINVRTEDFSFDVVCDYLEKGKPSLKYQNIRRKQK